MFENEVLLWQIGLQLIQYLPNYLIGKHCASLRQLRGQLRRYLNEIAHLLLNTLSDIYDGTCHIWRQVFVHYLVQALLIIFVDVFNK